MTASSVDTSPSNTAEPSAIATSAFAPVQHLIEQYHAVVGQLDEPTKQRLEQIQNWQRERMAFTHEQLFKQEDNQLLGQFFLERLYGSTDHTTLVAQISRMLKYAQKIEKLTPQKTIQTAILSLNIALTTILLDIELAHYMTQNNINEVSNSTITQAYIATEQQQRRLQLLADLQLFGEYVDQYAHSFIVLSAFKMAKKTAYKHQFDFLYDFMAQGFAATKSLKSTASFLAQFTDTEKEIVAAVHHQQEQPFGNFNLLLISEQ